MSYRRPIIFSGTTEGRKLSEKLAASGVRHIVCVATEYGELVMEPSEYADVRRGRMTALEMYNMISDEALYVFDATHPYAAEVSANISTACRAAGRDYVRIIRREELGDISGDADIHLFPCAQDCSRALAGTEGNILLTTGSKELGIYAADEKVRERLYARVLPSHESIRACEEAGLSGRQIIAMQGPFTMDMDLAMIRQLDIRILVTKSSGAAGGAPDKIRAAAEAGIPVYMIGRPSKETGMSVDEALRRYCGIAGKMHIDLVGIGPGRKGLMTAEAEAAVRRAGAVFGAKRMISGYESSRSYPYYRAEDIIPVLEELRPERAAVLFSGDTGFYSGAGAIAPRLSAWAKRAGIECSIKIHPGISSFTYLAARAGVSYQDAELASIHGCSGDKSKVASLVRTVRHSRKTFVLLSGAGDVSLLGEVLDSAGLRHVHIILGYQLSYPEERIGLITCSDCALVSEPGLYTAIVINEHPEAKRIAPVLGDDDMIRGKVPMTKESIRHLSILRLELTEDAVLYDIGSGTGSVACEAAGLMPSGRVYAVEMKEEACRLIQANADSLELANIEVVQGRAPEAFTDLEKPTHAFIGGSSGSLRQILDKLREKAGGIRVVINAVSLETMAEITEILKDVPACGLTVEQVSVSRAREIGSYHLMTAENPVMIAAFTLM